MNAMEKPVTKRQLGMILILLGLGGVAAPFVADLLQAGQFAGVGPMQRLVVGFSAVVVLLGLSLLPLGDRPA